MPLYDYKCKACDHSFRKLKSVDSRKEPIGDGCPICKAFEVIQEIGTSNIVSGVSMKDTRSDWFRSKMKELKSHAGPGNKMSDII
jgi:putative FmdB family regulatory protein